MNHDSRFASIVIANNRIVSYVTGTTKPVVSFGQSLPSREKGNGINICRRFHSGILATHKTGYITLSGYPEAGVNKRSFCGLPELQSVMGLVTIEATLQS